MDSEINIFNVIVKKGGYMKPYIESIIVEEDDGVDSVSLSIFSIVICPN